MPGSNVSERYLPPLELNYNCYAKTMDEQKPLFDIHVTHVLPFLLQQHAARVGEGVDLRILDVGCGFSPFAYGLVPFLKSTSRGCAYTGLDIRADAISWLSETYAEHPEINFVHHEADVEVDYVEAEKQQAQSLDESEGDEGAYQLDGVFNLQWSASVFTHMTPAASRNALRAIAKHADPEGIQVNTWLIVDELSRYAMRTGQADRSLEFDCGDFLTSSERNPLLCTAYKLDAMRRLYDGAGLEILEILPGSWRGYTTNDVLYQDIVISRLKRN